MFSYNTPKLKFKLNTKALSIFLTAVYAAGIIPMLIMGFYNFPSADDFSMALETHQTFEATGSFIKAIGASLAKSFYVYSHYEGYFFSIILTDICPGAFGEKWYFVVPFIIIGMLTFGVCYFFDALFVRVWKLDRHLTNSAAMITLIMMIQCMPKGGMRAEAFYWYSGAVNYTFTFGMAFFWLGLLMRCVYDKAAKARKRKLFWASFWGFWLGGANYLTALELAICSVLILFIFFMVKRGTFKLQEYDDYNRKSFGYIWIPALINLIGFGFSCFTPGVAVRSAETSHYGPVKAILLSLYSTFDMVISDMMRWETIAFLVLLVPVFWKLSEGLRHKLQHPVLFTAFAYLLVSSNMTPPFFATANIEAGRLKALIWMEFVFMMSLVVFYLTAWLRQYLDGRYGITGEKGDETKFSETLTSMIVLCVLTIAFGSGLCVVPETDYYCATSAMASILSGDAAIYRSENSDRLEILKDESVRKAGLVPHSVLPELLFYQDVTYDSSEWINYATATYYGKDEVYLTGGK